MDKKDPYFEEWAKCPFCGAYNGLNDRPLQQHRPRCLFKGNADDRSVMVPNHELMIREDDKTFLPMFHALTELPMVKAKLRKALEELEEIRKDPTKARKGEANQDRVHCPGCNKTHERKRIGQSDTFEIVNSCGWSGAIPLS